MCTVITLLRPGHAWPLLLAANRDERLDRPWDPPAAHWPAEPTIVGGRDRLGGGTWMAVNGQGVAAAVLNRPGSLGPAPGKRSRGTLPLLAARHATAAAAAAAIAALEGPSFRSFNMVLADRSAVWFVRNDDSGRLTAAELAPGLHMATAHDPDDERSARVARHLPRFRTVPAPEPPDWDSWVDLLGDSTPPREAALSVPPVDGFGTTCASLLAIPSTGAMTWMFAPGRVGHAGFAPVQLPRVAGGLTPCYRAQAIRGYSEWPGAGSFTRARQRSCLKGRSPALWCSTSRTTRPRATAPKKA